MNRLVLVLAAIVLPLVACSSPKSSGRHYTIAKVNRENRLVAARRILEEGRADNLDKVVDAYFGLTIDGGYVRYLQAIVHPEIAIFSKVTVRRPEEAGADAGYVFQNVYLASEKDGSHIELNKDSTFPRADIEILPPFQYKGEIVTVELRVIEIDSDDNERTKQLINLAASAAAAGAPESAAAISVFQTVLTFLVENNRDDIEFMYDFQLASSSSKLKVDRSLKYDEDQLLQPRVGTYVVVKSEHPDRVRLPDSILGFGSESLQWLGSKVLQLGTLNLLNWELWETVFCAEPPVGDRYNRLFGRPFAIETAAWTLPETTSDGLVMPNQSYFGAQGDSDTFYPFVLDNKTLKTQLHPPSTEKEAEFEQPEHYREQSYVVFSITEHESGISYEQLAALARVDTSVDALSLRTTQATPEEWKAGIDKIRDSSMELFLEKRKQKAARQIARAETDEEKQAAVADYEAYVKQLRDYGFLGSDTGRQKIDDLKRAASGTALALDETAFNVPAAAGKTIRVRVPTGVDLAATADIRRVLPGPVSDTNLPSYANLPVADGVVTLPAPFSAAPAGVPHADALGKFELHVVADEQTRVFAFVADAAATIDAATLDADELRVSGKFWQFAKALEVKLTGKVEGTTLVEDDAIDTLVFPFDERPEAVDGVFRVTKKHGQLAERGIARIRVVMPDGMHSAMRDYEKEWLEYPELPNDATAATAEPFYYRRNRKTELPAGGTFAVTPDLPSGFALDGTTGVVTRSVGASPNSTTTHTIRYQRAGTSIEAKVELRPPTP
jgi:hypothetical protein